MDNLIFEFRLLRFWAKRFIHKLFKRKKMANLLAEKIRALTVSKIDFVDEEAEAIVEGLATATLELDDKADAFLKLADGDVNQEEIGEALVDLADLFDDENPSAEKQEKLNAVVDRLLKYGTEEQKQSAKDLFPAVLGFGVKAKACNDYFDNRLAPSPE